MQESLWTSSSTTHSATILISRRPPQQVPCLQSSPVRELVSVLTGHAEAQDVTQNQCAKFNCLSLKIKNVQVLKTFFRHHMNPRKSLCSFRHCTSPVSHNFCRQAAKTRRLVAIKRSEMKLSPATMITYQT